MGPPCWSIGMGLLIGPMELNMPVKGAVANSET